jgi:hypothetical protein
MKSFCYRIIKNRESLRFKNYHESLETVLVIISRYFCKDNQFFSRLCVILSRRMLSNDNELPCGEDAPMTVSEKGTPATKNWADEIDDLNREAMERYLEGMLLRRALTRVSGHKPIDDQAPAVNDDPEWRKAIRWAT